MTIESDPFGGVHGGQMGGSAKMSNPADVQPDVEKLALSVIVAKAAAHKAYPDKPECWLKDEAMMAQARHIWDFAHAVWMVGNMDTEHDKAQWWRDFEGVWNRAAEVMRFNPPQPTIAAALRARAADTPSVKP